MAQIDIENTKQQARELLDSRIDSVTALVKATQHVADLKSELAIAEKEAKRAYVRAAKDGWTADELKKLGLENSAAAKRRSTTTQQKKSTDRSAKSEATSGRTNATVEE